MNLVAEKLDPEWTDSNRVKVAILDSGIDTQHTDIDALSDRIKSIRSWVDGKAGVEDWSGGDVSGHGTHVSGIILDLAPDVDIYVARITKTREPDDPDQIAKVLLSSITFVFLSGPEGLLTQHRLSNIHGKSGMWT